MHRIEVRNQNILGLDVSVDHVPVLEVEQSFDHLGYYMSCTVFREALLSAQLLIKIAMFTVFEDDIDVFSVVEVAMKTHNVWMVKSPLDFKLSFHLAEEIEFF